MQLLYVSQDNRTKTINIENTTDFERMTVKDLKNLIMKTELRRTYESNKRNKLFKLNSSKYLRHTNLAIPEDDYQKNLLNILLYNFRLILCNKELRDSDLVSRLSFRHTFHFKVRLVGGKGGFGATLRSQKPKHPMTMNFDACRDLSGRRIRHVRQQQDLENWHKQKAEEEKKIEEELDDFKKHEKEIKAAINNNDRAKELMQKKFKNQLEVSSNDIINGVLLGKAQKKRKFQEMAMLDDAKKSTLVKKTLEELQKDEQDKEFDFDDLNFLQNQKKKNKRSKVSEKYEKEIHEDNVDEEESLMIKPKLNTEEELEKNANKRDQKAESKAIYEEEKNTEKDISPQVSEEEKKALLFETLQKISDIDALTKMLTDDQVKEHLGLLGLKSGGRPEERIKRLMMVKSCEGNISKLPKKMFAKRKNK
ncbi:unnamed protein product [Moneuplotes crassus]|uniref:Sde2 N-terminal ubiquitin domain-containing protein n=2 Tax=Euplotes crassus TaxID=5936 RepID=A0AAD1UA38_EUPCR|nr:unnamed protein product [Moneuplotes crassus]